MVPFFLFGLSEEKKLEAETRTTIFSIVRFSREPALKISKSKFKIPLTITTIIEIIIHINEKPYSPILNHHGNLNDFENFKSFFKRFKFDIRISFFEEAICCRLFDHVFLYSVVSIIRRGYAIKSMTTPIKIFFSNLNYFLFILINYP